MLSLKFSVLRLIGRLLGDGFVVFLAVGFNVAVVVVLGVDGGEVS